jgi:hypothetical protein
VWSNGKSERLVRVPAQVGSLLSVYLAEILGFARLRPCTRNIPLLSKDPMALSPVDGMAVPAVRGAPYVAHIPDSQERNRCQRDGEGAVSRSLCRRGMA